MIIDGVNKVLKQSVYVSLFSLGNKNVEYTAATLMSWCTSGIRDILICDIGGLSNSAKKSSEAVVGSYTS